MKDLAEGFSLFHQLIETIPNLPRHEKTLAQYKEAGLIFAKGSTENSLLQVPERIFLPRVLHPTRDPVTREIIPDRDLEVAFLYFYQVEHPAPRDLEWVTQMLVQPTDAGILEVRAVLFLAQRSAPTGGGKHKTTQTVKTTRFAAGNFQAGHFVVSDIEQKTPLQLVKLAYGLATIYKDN